MPSQFVPHISLFDDLISSKENLRNCYLCVEIGVSGFSFIIYHKQKNSILGLENFSFGKASNESEVLPILEQLFSESEWLNKSFYQVVIVFNNPSSTLVPIALFNEKDKQLYLEFNQTISEIDSITHDLLRNTQAANVYAIPGILASFFDKKWPEAKKIHFSSCVIETLSNHFKNRTDDKTLYLNVGDESFDLVYFKESKLFFYNQFRYKSKEDFAYFLLLVMEQLKLSPEETKLELTGKISEDSENYNILHQYVRHHRFIERNDSYAYSDLLNEELCRQFFVLMNVLQCV